MVRTLARRSAVGALAALTATAGLMAPAQAQPTAVPLDRAGSLIGWGNAASAPARTLPETLQASPVVDVATGTGFTVATTAAGKVHAFGNPAFTTLPEGLADTVVTEVAAGATNAGAVTAAGTVAVWGNAPAAGGPNDVPPGLTGVSTLAVGSTFAAAVKTDGTVVAWGQNALGQTDVPAGLTGVKSVAAGSNHGYALKSDGTVAAWGQNTFGQTTLPAALTVPGNVKDIAARALGGLALLADGSVVSWGQGTPGTQDVPADLAGKTIVAIDAISSANLVIDSTGAVRSWGSGIAADINTPPSSLATADVSALSFSGAHAFVLVPSLFLVEAAGVSGSAQVGQTLTGTPATFTGGADVTHQWLADGTPIEGATSTTLTLTTDHLGQAISFRSTGTLGDSELDSTSAVTTAVVDAPPAKVASTTTISAPTSRYGSAGRATVTVTNGDGRPVTGAVTLSGAGAAQKATLVGGKATFTLGRSLAARAYTLTATYAGSDELNPSSRTVKHTVAKAKTKRPTFKTTKRPSSKKKGKATVTVARNRGLANATGRVTVTLKKGKSTKKVNATLSRGKRSISLPKLKKGTWKVTVTYRGDRNYVTQKSTTYRLKVKK